MAALAKGGHAGAATTLETSPPLENPCMQPFLKSTLSLLAVSSLFMGAPGWLLAADPKTEHSAAQQATAGSDNVTITGEVVDLVCYTDSGASGPGHADCAKVCITSGLPVGLKAQDGKTYVVVGDHKPLNSELAPYAARTITMKGKVVSRDGINLLENAEIVK